MKKKELHFDCEIDFELIAVSANLKGYRIGWLLNKYLEIELTRKKDFEFTEPALRLQSIHEVYLFEDEINYLEYVLISNKDTGKMLVPGLKAADYLLMIRGGNAEMHVHDVLKKIRLTPEIQTAFLVKKNEIKSIENLLLI